MLLWCCLLVQHHWLPIAMAKFCDRDKSNGIIRSFMMLQYRHTGEVVKLTPVCRP